MLLLLPNLLNETDTVDQWLPKSVGEAVQTLQGIIAESEKEARRYLKRFLPETFRNVPIRLLNEHTTEIEPLLEPLRKGERWGLISDCGLPCLADPGAALVKRARQLKIPIEAYAGPSSIVLALMLSGLSGQHFTFHGYLEREEAKLTSQIRTLEGQSGTHICIEAPYRSPKLLTHLIATLHPKTILSVAWDIGAPTQGVITEAVATWRTLSLPPLDKKPAVFLFGTQK
jgi:16S rRNA (cytidine1402-2'-O)-methyltransferase